MTEVATLPKHAHQTSLDEAMLVLHELDRALSFHLQWLQNLHRTLICIEPPSPDDIADDAHCRCNFGLWYYHLDRELLAQEPGIAELEAPHRAMHDSARVLLAAHASGGAVPADAYEAFMSLATDFKQRMRSYQFQLIQRVCSVDHLTGVWNRNYMTMKLAAEAERARRSRQTCAIALLDLDWFKHVNDSYGHVAGDRVLHEVARFLKDNLRAYDSMFRFGGEEFLICLPDTDIAGAEPLLNRLRERLAMTAISLPNHGEIHITASFGVAALAPDDEVTLAIERADHALLYAKGKGRNRVCAWSLSGDFLPPEPGHGSGV
ncbi:MAG: diguanylate cyclase [Gallionellaceae bacterium]|nr:diguanylate cyclase [Gallionellaceae bacterium]